MQTTAAAVAMAALPPPILVIANHACHHDLCRERAQDDDRICSSKNNIEMHEHLPTAWHHMT